MKKTLIQKLGLIGIVSFLSYAATGFNAALGIHLFCTDTDKINYKLKENNHDRK